MTGGPRRAGMCLTVLVLVVAAVQAAAQAGDTFQEAADGTAGQPQSFPPLDDTETFHSGSKSRFQSPRLLHQIFREDTESVDRTRARDDPRDLARAREAWFGTATQVGPRNPLPFNQTSRADPDYDWLDSLRKDSPGEEKPLPVPGDESVVSWSREADQWAFQEGQWKEVHLPDPAYPSLQPPPHPPSAALVVASVDKVEVERKVEGLKNVTLHCSFYLSDSHHPDTLPELQVYIVKDGSRTRLPLETMRGTWQDRTIDVPEADVNSSIIIEAWLKAEEDIIALSDLYMNGVTPDRDQALDADVDEMTLTANTTGNVTSTLKAEGNSTEAADHDSEAGHNVTDDTQLDTSQSIVEGDAEEGTGTATSTPELEASTDTPESETEATEQINESTDVETLNSSTSGGDNMTSGENVSSNLNANLTEEEESTTAPVTDIGSVTSGNSTEDALETGAKEDNATSVSRPGLNTDLSQANSTVTPSNGNITATFGPMSPETPSNTTDESRSTDGRDGSTSVFGTDNGSPGTTLRRPESSAALGNITEETVFPGDMMESTMASSGNSTDTVLAVPMSSTSWQVFQVFIVLCVIGFFALGFLYWRRKSRQDDEIPVFTRHTDYHNPTFTMEDAASFMSRVGRSNTYKTID